MSSQMAIERMANELIKRKQQWDLFEKKKLVSGWVSLAACCMLVFIISGTASARSLPQEELFASPLRILLLLLLAICIVRLLAFTKKATKKETEFENLRQEFIERSDDFWPSERTEREKDAFMREMNDRYNINLYHYH